MALVSPQALLASESTVNGASRLSRLRGGVLMILGPVLAAGTCWALAKVGPELLAPASAGGDLPWLRQLFA